MSDDQITLGIHMPDGLTVEQAGAVMQLVRDAVDQAIARNNDISKRLIVDMLLELGYPSAVVDTVAAKALSYRRPTLRLVTDDDT